MEIEGVISRTRAGIAQALECEEDMDKSGWNSQEGVLMPGNHARALLTEIDYWRARCGKAEKFIDESPCDPDIHEDQIAAHNEWQAAVAGESNKQAWLYGIPATPVE